MDIKRYVSTRIWTDPWFEELEPEEKLVWIYLLTNPSANLCGIYELSLKRISSDTGLTREQVRKAFEGFESLSKAFHIDGYVVVKNWVKNQSLNTNMVTSIKTTLDCLPDQIRKSLAEKGLHLIEPKAFESLSKALRASQSGKIFNGGFSIFTENDTVTESLSKPFEAFKRVSPIEIEIESESEKEIENESEIEGENSQKVFLGILEPLKTFLTENKIYQVGAKDFLQSEEWFNTKAMQLGYSLDEFMKFPEEFILDVRDRDLLDNKALVELRSHFISWVKKKKTSAKAVNNDYVPSLSNH